ARLQRTLDAVYTIVFGSEDDALATAAAVRAVHDRVQGPGYQANDPSLLLWVHATLVDTALRVHARFLGPLRPDDADEYYEESKTIAELLGVPAGAQPGGLADFRAYVRDMVGSLQVSEQARDLARTVLHPPVPWPASPLVALGRELTVGLLPPPVRRGFGFTWDARRQAALAAASLSARQVLSRTPAAIRRVRVA
ncbi:MAG TPA: oxygenase MpaB family protein, partial [Acidimicrobiales bacterium]|nr:oxygenase MpaB family protein [Acidimicrobiales bacterium]